MYIKVKTSELEGSALDWVVAKCEGLVKPAFTYERSDWLIPYSIDWAQGGPIIEREKIILEFGYGLNSDYWLASISNKGYNFFKRNSDYGETALIAAMRCYVASKLGDTVEIPTELLKG